MIMSRFINTVGNALELTCLGFDKVVRIYFWGGLTPLDSIILEVANGFFVLGVYADDWVLMTFKQPSDTADIAKLLVSLGNLGAFNTFSIGFEAIVPLF